MGLDFELPTPSSKTPRFETDQRLWNIKQIRQVSMIGLYPARIW